MNSRARGALVAVVIPALNEESSLPRVLARMPSDVGVTVVCDNGSTDTTVAVARAAGAVVVHESRRGYGAACLAGIAYLTKLDEPPAVVVFIDADGSDDPTDVNHIISPILNDEAELVLGVRRGVDGDVGTILPHARLGNRIVLGLTASLFGKRFRDLPPFRAISFPALISLSMDDRDWGWTLQMQIRAAQQGLRILEVDVSHRRRVAGVSKISGSLAMSARVGAKMFYTLARERLRSRRGSR